MAIVAAGGVSSLGLKGILETQNSQLSGAISSQQTISIKTASSYNVFFLPIDLSTFQASGLMEAV